MPDDIRIDDIRIDNIRIDNIRIDNIRISISARSSRPPAAFESAHRVLFHGGFVPRLRQLARALTSEYPELRRVKVIVHR